MRALRGGAKKPPPLMDPSRDRDRNRILALFRPYRTRLTIVLVMIMASAAASLHNPFLLRSALELAARGWHVFPCRPDNKRPMTKRSFYDAVTEPDQIKRLFAGKPDAATLALL